MYVLVRRYTDFAIKFIRGPHPGVEKPFLLMMAYNHVHTPNFASHKWCAIISPLGATPHPRVAYLTP